MPQLWLVVVLGLMVVYAVSLTILYLIIGSIPTKEMYWFPPVILFYLLICGDGITHDKAKS